jgi:hypothetical protein
VSTTRDEFLRRYATSPIHVPRLERLLLAYGDDDDGETFARQFIAWDLACRDGEAARIVSEIISTCLDESGRIRRLSDDVVASAIKWMAEATSYSIADRAKLLETRLQI